MSPIYRGFKILSLAFSAIIRSILPPKKNSALMNTYSAREMRQCVLPSFRGGHITLMKYRNPTTMHCIRSLKYERCQKSILFSADILREVLLDEYYERESLQKMEYILCTVPETIIRSQKDGYNHLHLILSKLYTDSPDIPIRDERDLLFWRRDVQRQSSLKRRRDRIENVREAMGITDEVPAKTVCFVIDDITTTGSTLNEASRALREGGAMEVVTIALAR